MGELRIDISALIDIISELEQMRKGIQTDFDKANKLIEKSDKAYQSKAMKEYLKRFQDFKKKTMDYNNAVLNYKNFIIKTTRTEQEMEKRIVSAADDFDNSSVWR